MGIMECPLLLLAWIKLIPVSFFGVFSPQSRLLGWAILYLGRTQESNFWIRRLVWPGLKEHFIETTKAKCVEEIKV